MSIEAIRSAFMAADKGVLRLTHAGLAYKDSHQVLTFAGWHADGTTNALPGTKERSFERPLLYGQCAISVRGARRQRMSALCPLPGSKADPICSV